MSFDAGEIQFNRLKLVRGISATISRDGEECPVTVVLGGTDLTAVNNREATYAVDTQEILVAAADYKPTGMATAPEDADVIVYSEAGQRIWIELRPPNESQACFRRWPGGRVFQLFGKVMKRE